MAILIQCPQCWRQLSLKRDICPNCCFDLKNARKHKNIKYVAKLYYSSLDKYKTEYFENLKDAQKSEREHTQAKEEHGDDAVLYLGEKVTVSELLDWFLGLKKIQRTARYKNKVYAAHQKVINENIGPYPVVKLTLTTLEDFQADIGEQYKPNYVDSIFKTLKQAINRGIDDDQLPLQALKPFRKFKPAMSSKNADARYRIITQDEFDILYENARPHHKPLLATLYWTGMRPGEALQLVWQQINLAKRQIILENTDTKTEEPRVIPIVPPLYEILKVHPRALKTPCVFHFRGKGLINIYQSMRALSKKVDIPWGRRVRGGWTLHDLRHTWVTNARRAGVAESVIMKITGHKTREMFDRYNFIDETDAMHAGALLTQFRNHQNLDPANKK
mgnify:CR=1 FL=1